jgi:hypothetical protein
MFFGVSMSTAATLRSAPVFAAGLAFKRFILALREVLAEVAALREQHRKHYSHLDW